MRLEIIAYTPARSYATDDVERLSLTPEVGKGVRDEFTSAIRVNNPSSEWARLRGIVPKKLLLRMAVFEFYGLD